MAILDSHARKDIRIRYCKIKGVCIIINESKSDHHLSSNLTLRVAKYLLISFKVLLEVDFSIAQTLCVSFLSFFL